MRNQSQVKVLVSTSTFPIDLESGVPQFVFDLARALNRLSDVQVLAPDSPGARRSEELGGLNVRRFTYWLPRSHQALALGEGMRSNVRTSWMAKLQTVPFLMRQAIATRRLLRDQAYHVVNPHWIIPQGLTAAWACSGRPGVRLVLQVHGGDVFLLKKIPLGRAIARYVVSRCDAVFVAGSYIQNCLNEILGYEAKTVLQPMGVDYSVFARNDESASQTQEGSRSLEFRDGYLLFVGRMIEIKGTKYLIRALPRILTRFPDIGLLLVGDGPERHGLEQEADRLGVADSVRFLGRRPHEDVLHYLRGCRVAVIPSIIDDHGETEGMPTVVVEAMAAGARVVGAAVDGIPDLIRHAENGWLCRQRDPVDLADKILAALGDTTPSEIVAKASETARRYDWSQIAANYMRCFGELLERESIRSVQ